MIATRKICMLGDFAVGKTSLVRRYVLDQFTSDYRATIGVGLTKYADLIETGAGTVPLDLVIWDIEGSDFGRDLLASYLEGASGALVVGDLTRRDALASMESHARMLQDRRPGRPVVFALNKADLVDPAAWYDGAPLQQAFPGSVALHSSAATGAAVPELFRALGRRILEIGA
jgi:small GTP-binding protein